MSPSHDMTAHDAMEESPLDSSADAPPSADSSAGTDRGRDIADQGGRVKQQRRSFVTQTNSVKHYLNYLATEKEVRYKQMTLDKIAARREDIKEDTTASNDVMERLDLRQEERDLERMEVFLNLSDEEIARLKAGFVEHASKYSQRKNIEFSTWQEFGVPERVLREAGVQGQPLRRSRQSSTS